MRIGLVLLSALTAAVSASALALQPGGGGGPPPASVSVAEATMQVLEKRRDATGGVVSLRRALLASREEGLVVELLVNEGDQVEQGALLAKLDDELLRLERAMIEADLAAAEGLVDQRRAELDRDAREVERINRLAAERSASETQIDNAQTQERQSRALLAQAQAEAQSRRAELARLDKRLADMRIVAPFSGRVISKGTEVGEWLDRGGEVVELVSMSELEVRVDVPESVVGRVGTPGQEVSVRFPGIGGTMTGTVIGVIPSGDPLSRTFPLRLAVDNAEGLLRPGMSAVASVPTTEREAVLTIPKDAVLRDDAGEYVYFNAGGQAVPARITTLFASGNLVAIRSGGSIFPGAQVVVEGNERLFPTQPLNILNASAVEDAPGPSAGAGGEG